MKIRLAFSGFNPSCARLAESLASSQDVHIAGVVADEIPSEWPSSLDTPPLFADHREIFRGGGLDLLLVSKEDEDLQEVPAGCQVIPVHEGGPAALLLAALAGMRSSEAALEEEIREIVALCASVNVIEAYSDPVPKLTQLLDRAVSISGADAGMVLLPGEVLDELSVSLVRGEGMDELAGRGLGVSGSLCGKAFDTGKALQGDITGDVEEVRCFEGTGLNELLAMPMRAEGRVIGIFALGSRREGQEFDAFKRSLLTFIAEQAGLVMQISHLYSELETNVVRDTISGLYNQHYFHQVVNDEVSRAHRYSLNVCLVVLEIDGFEDYMERNGRTMGDLILSDVGNIIRRNTREVDVGARCRDERFAILLPETRRLGAMRLAERIRKVMEEYPFPCREMKEVERMTICAGIASFPTNAEDASDLLEKTLAALAAAKAAGPNNIRLYSPNMTGESGA